MVVSDQQQGDEPEDLSPQAVKVARRLQALQSGLIYGILLVKTGRDEWILCIEERGKAERIRA